MVLSGLQKQGLKDTFSKRKMFQNCEQTVIVCILMTLYVTHIDNFKKQCHNLPCNSVCCGEDFHSAK